MTRPRNDRAYRVFVEARERKLPIGKAQRLAGISKPTATKYERERLGPHHPERASSHEVTNNKAAAPPGGLRPGGVDVPEGSASEFNPDDWAPGDDPLDLDRAKAAVAEVEAEATLDIALFKNTGDEGEGERQQADTGEERLDPYQELEDRGVVVKKLGYSDMATGYDPGGTRAVELAGIHPYRETAYQGTQDPVERFATTKAKQKMAVKRRRRTERGPFNQEMRDRLRGGRDALPGYGDRPAAGWRDDR